MSSNSDNTSHSSSYDFLYKPQKVPCFRQSMLYGLGGGMVLGALRFYRTRNPWKTTDVAVFSTLLFSTVSWVICRYEFHSYREQLRKSFDLQQQLEEEYPPPSLVEQDSVKQDS
ncbi:hypothetical protein GAYE_PCTG44G1109 [Galdieria yellowstonensis]|uniref:Cytochrome c oxidase assembly protein COX20, mitochondrial n=1 Tax=Galdieria yellowstonensis TaxID=3028027 RepID=A0AAV9I3K7_9RHOD|nr:hypothetical protein GAYE_PCTG44G1109 [Galdieria yellowstonensis]